jgi:hypothetical protein
MIMMTTETNFKSFYSSTAAKTDRESLEESPLPDFATKTTPNVSPMRLEFDAYLNI